jgi:hypothetical protein
MGGRVERNTHHGIVEVTISDLETGYARVYQVGA